jgi:uncharacterized protein YerC
MSYESRFKNEEIDELFKAILALETKGLLPFFEDICTINETMRFHKDSKFAKLLYDIKPTPKSRN